MRYEVLETSIEKDFYPTMKIKLKRFKWPFFRQRYKIITLAHHDTMTYWWHDINSSKEYCGRHLNVSWDCHSDGDKTVGEVLWGNKIEDELEKYKETHG